MIFDMYRKDDIERIRKILEGNVVGLTSGCWDLIHEMHLQYLIRCRRLCDILIVGVDSDDLVRSMKGPKRPNINEYSRARMIDALKYVDFTYIMGEVKDFGIIVEALGVNKIFKNDVFKDKKVKVEGAKHAQLIIVPDIALISSTSEIINVISNNEKRGPGRPPKRK